jgi:hypothetical protein
MWKENLRNRENLFLPYRMHRSCVEQVVFMHLLKDVRAWFGVPDHFLLD